MSRNSETVQSLYRAFGEGNVPAILACLSPEVRWEAWDDHSAQRAGHPMLTARTGPGEVAGFFAQLAATVTIHEFQVLDILGEGRQVAAEIRLDCTYSATGRRLRDEELHLWSFDEQGRVVRFRHYIDTAKHLYGAGLLERLPAAAGAGAAATPAGAGRIADAVPH